MLKRALVAGLLMAGTTTLSTAGAQAAAPKVIHLTQTACQFIEAENGVDHAYSSTKKADCEAINARTGDDRIGTAKVLELDAGSYVFRVSNSDVPYELGFWLRGQGLGRVTLPSVSGGGLHQGKSQDYAIDLEPGEYYYSCPLNTTPDYVLVVRS